MRHLLASLVALGVAASAQASLPQLTLGVQPGIAEPEGTVLLFGTVANPKPGEVVDIEARDCGQRQFRFAVSAHVSPNGRWSIPYVPGISTTLRAVRNGVTSRAVTVRQRVTVRLSRLPSSSARFQVAVVALKPLWRSRVEVQRLRGGRWTTLRTVTLTKTQARPGSSVVWSTGTFTAAVPRGTLLRAVMPLAQARPCYLAGASRTLRTS